MSVSNTPSHHRHSQGRGAVRRPSELEDQDIRATISVLNQRANQLMLLEDNTENRATVDRIDEQLHDLRAEQRRRAGGAGTRSEETPGQSGHPAERESIHVSRDTGTGVSEGTRTRRDRNGGDGEYVEREIYSIRRSPNGHGQTSTAPRGDLPSRVSRPGPHTPIVSPSQYSDPVPSEYPRQPTTRTSRPASTPTATATAPPNIPNPTTQALAAYATSFPHGHTTLPTPDTGLLCGLSATILTMRAMHPSPHPTLPSLQTIFASRSYARQARGFALTNHNNLHVDQVGLVLYLWGQQRGLNLQVGYVTEGGEPQLVPHPNWDRTRIVWISHLPEKEGKLGHVEGMRPREVGRMRELRKGVHRRDWVKRLDGKLAKMVERVVYAADSESSSSGSSCSSSSSIYSVEEVTIVSRRR